MVDLCSGQIFHPFSHTVAMRGNQAPVHVVSYSGKQWDTTQSTEFFLHISSLRGNTCAQRNRNARNDVLNRQEKRSLILLCTQTPLKSLHPEGLTWFSLQLHYTGMSRVIWKCWNQKPRLSFEKIKIGMNIKHQMFKHGHSLSFRFWRSSVTWLHFGGKFHSWHIKSHDETKWF